MIIISNPKQIIMDPDPGNSSRSEWIRIRNTASSHLLFIHLLLHPLFFSSTIPGYLTLHPIFYLIHFLLHPFYTSSNLKSKFERLSIFYFIHFSLHPFFNSSIFMLHPLFYSSLHPLLYCKMYIVHRTQSALVLYLIKTTFLH